MLHYSNDVMNSIYCLHCVLLTGYLPIRAEQLFQILLFHVGGRQIPNKNPSLQISGITTAAGAWKAARWRAEASSAGHDSIQKWFTLLSSCVSNAGKKRLVCSLIAVFKLPSEILKHQWVKRGDKIVLGGMKGFSKANGASQNHIKVQTMEMIGQRWLSKCGKLETGRAG